MRAACLRAEAAWVAWTSKSDIQSSTIRRLGSDAGPLLISWRQPESYTGAPSAAKARNSDMYPLSLVASRRCVLSLAFLRALPKAKLARRGCLRGVPQLHCIFCLQCAAFVTALSKNDATRCSRRFSHVRTASRSCTDGPPTTTMRTGSTTKRSGEVSEGRPPSSPPNRSRN